ncbi:MAG: hypothetical protein ACRD4T_00190 [Candidatus Acidiferrales bacterium]
MDAENAAKRKAKEEAYLKKAPNADDIRANAKLRAQMKAAAKKEGGLVYYVLGAEPFYRAGATYPPGSVVALPESEDPSITWEPYLVDSKPKAPPDKVEGKPNKDKPGVL